jgi:hypothetical protein
MDLCRIGGAVGDGARPAPTQYRSLRQRGPNVIDEAHEASHESQMRPVPPLHFRRIVIFLNSISLIPLV